MIVCRKCGRELHPWPIKRPASCSPKDWAHCIAPAEFGVISSSARPDSLGADLRRRPVVTAGPMASSGEGP